MCTPRFYHVPRAILLMTAALMMIMLTPRFPLPTQALSTRLRSGRTGKGQGRPCCRTCLLAWARRASCLFPTMPAAAAAALLFDPQLINRSPMPAAVFSLAMVPSPTWPLSRRLSQQLRRGLAQAMGANRHTDFQYIVICPCKEVLLTRLPRRRRPWRLSTMITSCVRT